MLAHYRMTEEVTACLTDKIPLGFEVTFYVPHSPATAADAVLQMNNTLIHIFCAQSCFLWQNIWRTN